MREINMDFTHQMLPIDCHIRSSLDKGDLMPLRPMDDFGNGYTKEEWERIKLLGDLYYKIVEAFQEVADVR